MDVRLPPNTFKQKISADSFVVVDNISCINIYISLSRYIFICTDRNDPTIAQIVWLYMIASNVCSFIFGVTFFFSETIPAVAHPFLLFRFK